jgi:hypothetical protein
MGYATRCVTKIDTYEKLKQVVYAVINGSEASTFEISFDFELKVKWRILKFPSEGLPVQKSLVQTRSNIYARRF